MMQGKQVRQLGATGLVVSPLGLGTNRWAYGKNDEAVSETFRAYVDAGGNFFDTAEVYGFGKSEHLLGTCLKQDARPIVIASKYMPLPLHPFKKALDGSLKRLGVQTIDLYYIHFPRGNIEKLMDQMAQAVADGKIRAIGVSNCSAVQMRQAAARLARYDIPLAANEVQYNLLHRQPEVNGVLDACRELNVALVAYVPLASGRLASTSSSSTRGNEALQTVFATIAHTRSKSVSQVALNWLVRRDEHIIPIPGATSARHVQENAEALTWELSDEEFAAIDQASRPHTS
jgi:aryl-alcohol dehydrogenase-like predicted oxidoreductase